jgi:hypothetical protein
VCCTFEQSYLCAGIASSDALSAVLRQGRSQSSG